ncbi:MAG: HNH endonuclease, partial [Caulobacteraceae bacterium]|nr:HNH endonuclease [Caulobacteraceae bacterium]
MTFRELYLCAAIHRAELGGGDRPTHAQRKQAAADVMSAYLDLFDDSYFPFTIDDVAKWAQRYRKGGHEVQTKVEIALAHGFRCPFHGRGKGPCSEEAEAGHIVQRSRGGPLSVENCWIECRAHNNQR